MRWFGFACLGLGAQGGPPELNIGAPHHIAVTPAIPGRASPATRAAGRLVTTSFWSQSLGARKQVVAWLPPTYDAAPTRRYPVAVYLHGLWGSETDWSQRGAIAMALDSLVAATGREMIVVMPDGDDSWYTTWNWLGDWPGCRRDFKPRDGTTDTADTYCVPWPHYDDYIARDLVSFVDRTWRTDARRGRRAIAGLSMGGYGALSLAFAYPDVFSVAASHSGVVSPLYLGPKPFAPPPRYATSAAELEKGWERLWPSISQAFGKDTTGWWSRDPARRARALWTRDRARMPALYLDIGTEDGLLDQNRAFRHELQALHVPHTYHEHPGAHDWAYWSRHVPASLRFIAERLAR